MKKLPRILARLFLVLAVVCVLTFTLSGMIGGHEVADTENGKRNEEPAVLTDTAQNDEPAVPVPVSTPVPTPEPPTVPATVKAENISAVAGTLARNDVVNIVDTYGDEYFVVQDANGNKYFVEKKYVRTNEDAYGKETSFFTKSDTPVYSSAYLEGKPDATLKINSIFVVSDELNGVAFGSYQPDGTAGNPVTGYVDVANLSAEELSTWTECDGFISADKTGIYANPDLKGTPVTEVAKRAQVHAYERIGDALRIKVTDSSVPVNGAEGYIAINAFSKEWPGYGNNEYYGYSGGGSNSWDFDFGGYSDYSGVSGSDGIDWSSTGSSGSGGSIGGGGSTETSGPLYGEDIHLAYEHRTIIKADFIADVKEETPELEITGTKGIVFSDGVELITAFYQKGDTVQLIEKDNDLFWTVLADHRACTIPAKSVLPEGESEEEEEPVIQEMDGYISRDRVNIYNNPELSGTPVAEVAIRVSVHVFEKIGNALHIEVTDPSVPVNGVKGYIPANAFSEEMPGFTWETYTPGNSSGYDWGYSDGIDFGGYSEDRKSVV